LRKKSHTTGCRRNRSGGWQTFHLCKRNNLRRDPPYYQDDTISGSPQKITNT
jgi:hypothetical protein